MSTAEGKQQLHTQDPVSRPLTFKVTRSAETDYPKPSVLQATDDRLDPINTLNGATVRAQYPAMLPSDILAADWFGSTTASSWQSDQQPGNLFGYVDFQAPVSVVAASQGKTVTLRYAVVRSGQAARLSLPLLLAVGTLAQTHLPAPVIPQANATTKVLDLNNFAGNAQVKVEPWPLIAVGQRVWARVDGTLENGSPHTFYLARGVEVIAEQVTAGLDLVLPRAQLENLRNGSELEVILNVGYDQDQDESAARTFPGLQLKLQSREFMAPTVPEASQGQITDLNRGASIVVPAAARLRQGEFVRGSMGTLKTDPVEVRTPGAALTIPVSPDTLLVLESEGILAWCYEVKINEQWVPSDSIPITVISSTPLFDDFESVPLVTIPIGQTLDRPGFTIRTERANVSVLQNGSAYPPLKGRVIYTGATGIVSFLLKRSCSGIEFDIADSSKIISTVSFYRHLANGNEELIGTIQTPPYTGHYAKVIYHSANERIHRVTFTDGGGSTFIDHFRMFP